MIKLNIKNKKGQQNLDIMLIYIVFTIILIAANKFLNIPNFANISIMIIAFLSPIFIFIMIDIIRDRKLRKKVCTVEDVLKNMIEREYPFKECKENKYRIYKYDRILKNPNNNYYVELIFTPDNKENFLVALHSENKNQEIKANYIISKNNDFRKIIINAIHNLYQ